MKQLPLWHRLYNGPVFTEVARSVGYEGCLYRELWDRLKPVVERFGQQRVESATLHLLFYEGQMTVNPKPLAKVQLRSDVRSLCWQLLGPPPEMLDSFYRYGDGTPMEHPQQREDAPKQNEGQPKPKKSRKKRAAS